MFFFSKAFFKYTAPRYVLPGRIDDEFYLEAKRRLLKNRNFKFRSEFNFWKSYRFIFMVFAVFVCSALLLSTFFILSYKQSFPIFGILIFILILTAQPAIYFCILMSYYLKYRIQENKFHNDFKAAVLKSEDFQNFSDIFYSHNYAGQLLLGKRKEDLTY